MTSSLTLLAALGVSAAGAAAVCTLVPARSPPAGRGGTPRVGVAARICCGLSVLCALAAAGALWSGWEEPDSSSDPSGIPQWGALWVYAAAMLVECRFAGLRSAGRRALAGLLLGGSGVLFLGVGLTAWTNTESPPPAGHLGWTSLSDMNALGIGLAAAFGLALVPLAGIAVGGTRPGEPPLSAAAASAVFAAWLQPALPALGWLPVSPGAGAGLAAILAAALVPLAFAASGGRRAACGVLATLALSVGGCIVLGIL